MTDTTQDSDTYRVSADQPVKLVVAKVIDLLAIDEIKGLANNADDCSYSASCRPIWLSLNVCRPYLHGCMYVCVRTK